MSERNPDIAKLLDDDSFVRWINNEATPEEQQQWEYWESQGEEYRMLKEQAKLLYELPMADDAGEDRKQQLARLNRSIDQREHNVWRLPFVQKRSTTAYSYAAATIALLIGVLSIILYSIEEGRTSSQVAYRTVSIDYGMRGTIEISDGSQITLNSNTKLRYAPEQLNADTIEVWLNGEGYFSITRNPRGQRRSFIVHTSEGNVEVLGTRFNVSTRDQQTNVVLEEGKVGLELKDSTQQARDSYVMRPGELAVLSKDNKEIGVQAVDPALYTSWTNHKMMFDRTALEKIAKDIEHTYGVDIQVDGSSLKSEKISGSVNNPDLQTLLDGLSEALDIEIRRTNNHITISRNK
ncbi:FecR family protein [Fodinibius salsisoli]|uniref:FecR domain-containing protein n=1 Tax=Fodinibius salsisoli TaxID=2820877 RepID=A0ABT3PQ49_9BACT|nr:FecR domain-containing protein [Fodinibius salsisoli]MCW9707987.1 FecR domain-containing protein [Fodinibius salsisoli]